MAVLMVQEVRKSQGGVDDPEFASDLYLYSFVEHPYGTEAFSRPGSSVLTWTSPVSANGRTIEIQEVGAFKDDYYYRIHLNPSRIALGNLLSSQVREVSVWNAYLTPQLLSSVVPLGDDGLTLVHPVSPPTTYAQLEERVYLLNVSTNGSPVIDALYTFNFEAESPQLVVTGRRVVVWPFMPQTTHREKLEWRTDVIPSFRSEQRLALRPAPRQSLSYKFQLDTFQFSRAKAMSTQWAHRVYGVPVWSELTRVGPISAGATEVVFDTRYADYRDDDILLLWESDTKFLAVETLLVSVDRITFKLPLEIGFSNAYVAPLRFGRTLQGMSFKRGPNDLIENESEFLVTENKDLSLTTKVVYRGMDVLLDIPVITSDITDRISRPVTLFDNGSGPIMVDVTNGYVRNSTVVSFDVLTREERWALRQWLHSRRGKQRGFWFPSWNPDIISLEDRTSISTSLKVRNMGFSLYYGIKDIMVEKTDGTRVFNRVLSSVVDPDGNESLGLELPLGVDLPVSSIQMICFIYSSRFDSDSITISHSYSGRASVSIPSLEVPQ